MNRFAFSTLVASGAALAVVGTSVGAALLGASDARAGGRAFTDESDLVVTLVTPTLNQEVLPDLSDPGVNNVVTVRFSSTLRAGDFIDNKNILNRLTPKVEFINSAFLRLPGNPTVSKNVFRFDPRVAPTGLLTPGQYTLTIRSSVRNTQGNLLNAGGRDFSTTFSVGTDVFPPVLRKSSPASNQQNVGLNQPITLTFNEPINPQSILSTIQVQNASTNPVTLIPGKGGTGLTTERDGFDVVFTPDPCFGYPPRTTIQLLMQGVAGLPPTGFAQPATVTDVFGNQFRRDPGLQWTADQTQTTGNPPVFFVYNSPNGDYNERTGIYRLAFTTKGITPPPTLIAPGSSHFNPPIPYSSPCTASCFLSPSCKAIGSGMYYFTGNGIGQLDLRPFFARLQQGITDLSLFTTIANAPVRMGRPSGMIVDPRYDLNNGFHTFLYVVDQRSATVLVVDSRSFKIIGRFPGFSQPTDVAIPCDFGLRNTTLAVTDFAANNVQFIDLQQITVNLNGQPGAPSPCDAIRDTPRNRTTVGTGAGPRTITSDSYILNKVLTANALDSSITVVDVKQAKALNTHKTGSNPVDADFTMIAFGGADMAAIVNQGGVQDPNGSVSMYLRLSGLNGRDGIESTLTDNVKNPTSVWAVQQWVDCNPLSPRYGWALSTGTIGANQFFVANTGGDTVLDLRISFQGGFGQLISFQNAATRKVGLNPTSAMYDAFNPQAPFLWVALGGLGQVGGMEPTRVLPPVTKPVAGVRRFFTALTH